MSRENERIELSDGRVIWNSRSIAVTAIVVVSISGYPNKFIVAGKRGKGCPDFVGYWNLPCGYLDWDETTKEAATREFKEETGLIIDPSKWTLYGINDDPKDSNRQNVTFRYKAELISPYFSALEFDTSNSEMDEVEEVKLIPIHDYNLYQWAFNHKELIESLLK